MLTAVGAYQLGQLLRAAGVSPSASRAHGRRHARARTVPRPAQRGRGGAHGAGDAVAGAFPDRCRGAFFVTHTRPEPMLGVLAPSHRPRPRRGSATSARGARYVAGMLFVNGSSWAHASRRPRGCSSCRASDSSTNRSAPRWTATPRRRASSCRRSPRETGPGSRRSSKRARWPWWAPARDPSKVGGSVLANLRAARGFPGRVVSDQSRLAPARSRVYARCLLGRPGWEGACGPGGDRGTGRLMCCRFAGSGAWPEGVAGAIIISAGFREAGLEGQAREAKLRSWLRGQFPSRAWWGPNCLGWIRPPRAAST